jgi:hypothetical protein
MTIFIPVLLICMNGTANCEFMQAKSYYKTDDQCRAVLDTQKLHMRKLVAESRAGTISLLEGTCVETDVQVTKGLTT